MNILPEDSFNKLNYQLPFINQDVVGFICGVHEDKIDGLTDERETDNI